MNELTQQKWRNAVRRGDTEKGFTDWLAEQEKMASAEVSFLDLTNAETATILAALRYYQMQTGIPVRITNIASDEGRLRPLSNMGIDDLCQKINTEQKTRKVEGYLLVHPDGKTATITTQIPGDRCKLTVKRLVAL